MKCLVVTTAASRETASVDRLQGVFATLDSMHIQFSRAIVGGLPNDSVVNDEFDFILFPAHTAGFDTIIDSAGITIPMFALFASSGTAGFGANPGVSGSRTGLNNYFVDVPFTSEKFVAGYVGGYTAITVDGKALAVISENEPNINAVFDGTTQGAAGGTIAAWRTITAGGSYLYCSAFDTLNHVYLHELMQEAINDGVLSAPPRRSPMVVDLDHINGQYTTGEPAILDKIASYIPDGGMMWCGIFNANVLYFSSAMDSEVVSRLQKYSGNKFKYCWHDHVSPITSGSYPNITELVNKADQETLYLADKVTWEDNGLEFHQPAYYDPGSNMWTESTMELFSGDTSITADGGNLVTQTGYGFRAFRCTRQSTRAQPIKTLNRQNQHAYQHSAHGIQLFGTWDLCYGSDSGALDMPYSTVADWRKNFQYINNCLSYGTTVYMHDEDFVAADQDPGVDQHGWVQAQILHDLSVYYKDVIHGFADPIDFVADNSMSMV